MKKDDLIVEKVVKNVGLIYFNRPDKINALNLKMVRDISKILKKWEEDDNIKAVLLDSKSHKGFCSGGDLVHLYKDFIINDDCNDKDELFVEEFELDKYVETYKKPIVSYWKGIVMGGGVGISINSDFIICDETVKWAMPETDLGFVPDVGVGKFISSLPQSLGQYVGLCGGLLESPDLIKHGLANLYIDSKDYEKIREKFFELSETYSSHELIEKLREEAEKYKKESHETFVWKNRDKIEKYFCEDSLGEIYKILEENREDEFARDILKDLKSKSQFSLDLQFEKYFVGKNLSYPETVDLDLKILKYCLKMGEMEEGIRSKMIDKDNDPDWKYKNLEDVKDKDIKKLLAI
ncbi:enoyl-CoA hydratase/isomerase family protein [Peptoniphilus timonensis]|uniref:enoyl-CoA hydratase/isomerase family protein n=1 Tax=Peptoniphilus timonensis TaxID=1268254 RepID=UPI0003036EFD|nr:enoyl-CoA hydratase/isomerase family protein [Peptoniphilus timonensis]